MPSPSTFRQPRMLAWIIATLLLWLAAQHAAVGGANGVMAVSLYKAHLMSLGGWGGYWLDRALFPYDRPHLYLGDDEPDPAEQPPDGTYCTGLITTSEYGFAMLRRAIVVAACLVCVGLGA